MSMTSALKVLDATNAGDKLDIYSLGVKLHDIWGSQYLVKTKHSKVADRMVNCWESAD